MRRERRGFGIWLASLALWLASALALAADPIVRVNVAAQRPVLPGQQIRIDVTVLAPNFFLSAPVFPTLQLPRRDRHHAGRPRPGHGRDHRRRELRPGIGKSYLFAAEQGGDFQLPQVSIAFT